MGFPNRPRIATAKRGREGASIESPSKRQRIDKDTREHIDNAIPTQQRDDQPPRFSSVLQPYDHASGDSISKSMASSLLRPAQDFRMHDGTSEEVSVSLFFSKLPLEIRNKIYGYVLPSNSRSTQGQPSDQNILDEVRAHDQKRWRPTPRRSISRRPTTRSPTRAQELLPICSEIRVGEDTLDQTDLPPFITDEKPELSPRPRSYRAHVARSERLRNGIKPMDGVRRTSAPMALNMDFLLVNKQMCMEFQKHINDNMVVKIHLQEAQPPIERMVAALKTARRMHIVYEVDLDPSKQRNLLTKQLQSILKPREDITELHWDIHTKGLGLEILEPSLGPHATKKSCEEFSGIVQDVLARLLLVKVNKTFGLTLYRDERTSMFLDVEARRRIAEAAGRVYGVEVKSGGK